MSFTDASLTKILYDLSTISKYKHGEVVDTTTDYINLQEQSIVTSISRTLNGDDRHKALMRFADRIGTAYEFAERIIESKYLAIYDCYNYLLTYGRLDSMPVGASGSLNDSDEIPPPPRPILTVRDIELYEIRYNSLVKIHDAIIATLNGLEEFKRTYECGKRRDSCIAGQCSNFILEVTRKSNKLLDEIKHLNHLRQASLL